MANDLLVKLKLQNNEFNNGLDNSKQKIKDFQSETDSASKSLEDLSKSGAKSAKDLLKEMNDMEKGTRSISNYRSQLSKLTRDIQDLTVNYNNMSKEMKDSELGREVISNINEMTIEAGKYKDAIVDAQAAIKNMSSDTQSWDAVKQGMQVVSSTLQSVAAAGILSANSTEKLVAVIAKLKAIESATNAVIQIGNALQKQSAVMTGISRLQTLALVKAKELETVSTVKATIAQKAFNAVANMNPYLALLSAASLLVGVIALFTKRTNENAEAQKKEQEEIEKSKKEFEDYKNKVGSSVGDIVAKFSVLQRSYRNLSTEMEKKKWIDENSKSFNELGLNIKDVNSADNVFVRQSEEVINALKARARADALIQLYKDKIIERTKKEIELEQSLTQAQKAKERYQTNGDFPADLEAAGIKPKDVKQIWTGGGNVDYILTPEQQNQLNEYYKNVTKTAGQGAIDETQRVIDIIDNMIIGAENEAAEAASKISNLLSNNTNNNNNNNNQTIRALEGSKKQVQELISKVQALKDAEVVGTEQWYKYNEQLTILQNKLNDIIVTEKKLTADPFKIPVLPVIEPNTKLTAPQSSLVMKVTPEVDENALANTIASITDNISKYLGVSSQFIGSLNSIYDSFNRLSEQLQDTNDGWKQFFLIFQAGATLVDSFIGIIKSVSDAISIMNSLFTASASAKAADTAASKANTSATISNAAAKGAEAAAQAGSSVASVPLAGPILAVGAIGSVMVALLALLSKAKSYNTGGIVGGNNYNDGILAKVSTGEMVLNQKQQANLFKLLNEGGRGSSNQNNQVEFKIHGTELVGVLSNISKKNSRI